LLPLVRGQQTSSNYPAIYGAYLDLQRSVTLDGWKLILYPQAKVIRLYNLTADPQEMNDLAADPSQAARKKDLFNRLVTLQRQFDDPLNLSKAFPNL
jgi:arylsulfatase A-like enzyme